MENENRVFGVNNTGPSDILYVQPGEDEGVSVFITEVEGCPLVKGDILDILFTEKLIEKRKVLYPIGIYAQACANCNLAAKCQAVVPPN